MHTDINMSIISQTIGFVNLFYHTNQVYFSIIIIKILDIIRQGVLPKAFGKSAELKYICNYINTKTSLRTGIKAERSRTKNTQCFKFGALLRPC